MRSEQITPIKKYLFDDVFNYFKEQGCENEKYRYINKKSLLNYKLFRLFIKPSVFIYNKIVLLRLKKIRNNSEYIYFFADTLIYKDIVNHLSHNFTLLINNPKRISNNIFNNKNIITLPLILITYNLINGYKKNNDNSIIKAISDLRELIKSAKLNFIVINDSIHPTNRALIYVSRELGVKTIEIQHATYPSKMPLIKGISADYIFVWGQFFKNMYLEQKIKTDKELFILGYPFELPHFKKNVSKLKTLYYLAQGFQYEDIKNLDILLQNALKLRAFCNANNLLFKCRLHPNSPKILLEKILPHVECTPIDIKLEDAISDGDIFVSFNSTALIQAELNNKICIQLINIPVETDNFEKLGTSIKSFYSIEDLEKYIIDLVINFEKYMLKKRNNEYVQIFSENPGNKFEFLIYEILKTKTL
jgi:hypothetical protein